MCDGISEGMMLAGAMTAMSAATASINYTKATRGIGTSLG